MDAQFQLGFELSSILNPVGQAVSALSSIALADAVRKAGSNVLTEVKLASFLGKNRIDAIVKEHFTQAVARSDQNIISRYLEIVLQSGAGPTVQNALKDAALFSMVIQMSLLCYVHEDQPFANAIIDAISRIVRNFRGNPKAIPDYPSLLGTMVVIKRETTAFQWSLLFVHVERTIRVGLLTARQPSQVDETSHGTSSNFPLERTSLKNRELTFPVLQALFLALESLQRFSEERRLYIECDRGICTLVVWCFHVLSLSVKVCIEDREITFGEGPSSVVIKEISTKHSSVSLVIPLAPNEPLFTLSSNDRDPKLGPELRANLLGFGQAALKQMDIQPSEMDLACYAVIAGALISSNLDCSCQSSSWIGVLLPETHEAHCYHHPKSYPSKSRIIETAQLFFDLPEVDESRLNEMNCSEAASEKQYFCAQLIPLFLSLSRVQQLDLQQCADLPLSLKVYKERCVDLPHAGRMPKVARGSGLFSTKFPSITESFEILARYLLDRRYSHILDRQAILVSSHGWSVYLDVADANDPSDVSICNLRILAGVPSMEDASNDRVFKSRILDGPTELGFSNTKPAVLKTDLPSGTSSVDFFPGLTSAIRGDTLIGFQDNDAFLASQSFTSSVGGTEVEIWNLGFRKMMNLCAGSRWSPPCHCDNKMANLESLNNCQVITIDGFDVQIVPPANLKNSKLSNTQYAICLCCTTPQPSADFEAIWMFHVTKNSAARWLQLAKMMETDTAVVIKDSGGCLLCLQQSLPYWQEIFKEQLSVSDLAVLL